MTGPGKSVRVAEQSSKGEEMFTMREGRTAGREGEREREMERETEREREGRTWGKDRAGFRQRILRIKPQCSVWQLLFLSQQA